MQMNEEESWFEDGETKIDKGTNALTKHKMPGPQMQTPATKSENKPRINIPFSKLHGNNTLLVHIGYFSAGAGFKRGWGFGRAGVYMAIASRNAFDLKGTEADWAFYRYYHNGFIGGLTNLRFVANMPLYLSNKHGSVGIFPDIHTLHGAKLKLWLSFFYEKPKDPKAKIRGHFELTLPNQTKAVYRHEYDKDRSTMYGFAAKVRIGKDVDIEGNLVLQDSANNRSPILGQTAKKFVESIMNEE